MTNLQEIWKDITDYEGRYQVSNFGRIKCLEKKRYLQNSLIIYPEKIMSLVPNHKGYLMVGLWGNGKYKTYSVHRIVAKHFVPNPDNLPQVNHKDTNKQNNIFSNLEWCTNSINIKHAHANNLMSHANYAKGQNHGMSKNSNELIVYIKELIGQGLRNFEIANMLNLRQNYISRIRHGHRRKVF